jgi:hypothetical protein
MLQMPRELVLPSSKTKTNAKGVIIQCAISGGESLCQVVGI